MSGVNKVFIVGHLGKNPEIKYMPNGKAVCNFSVATSEKWTDAIGQKQEKTEWHNIVVFEKQAENCGKYIEKGSLVCVEGKLQTRSWDDKDGNKKYKTEIIANSVTFLSKTEGQTQSQPGERSTQEPKGFAPQEELPF